MNNSKKLLSIFLVLILCFSTVVISSFSATGETTEDNRTVAIWWNQNDYRPDMANNDPTVLRSKNDGSFYMKSDEVKNQYQMYFDISEDNAESLKNAVGESCDFYDGFLSIDITVNSAYNIYGQNNCHPAVSVDFFCADGSKISTGSNIIQAESSARYIFDFSKFKDIEYTAATAPKRMYVQVQCYDWGCGGGKGTMPYVTFSPISVFNGIDDPDPVTVPTAEIDPNQKTFFNFNPKARNEYSNAPDDVKYSADGAKWKSTIFATAADYGYGKFTKTQGFCEQMQVSYNFNQMGDEYSNALNIANQEGGSGLMQVRVTLEKCVDTYGNNTIAEVVVVLGTQKGNQNIAPNFVRLVAWQYPGTTRTYYLDVSHIKHKSQISYLSVVAQNYWYYKAGTNELFDWDKESSYAGEEAAEALGHKKSKIKPTLVVSPVTVVQDNVKHTNTAYDLVLNDFNKNGGKVPANITLNDPNVDSSVISNPTTSSNATTVPQRPAKPTIKSAVMTASNAAKNSYSTKISWNASTNANSAVTNYEVYRAVGSSKAKYSKIATVSKSTLSYTDKSLQGGKAYYYKVRAVSTTSKLNSDFSAVKYVKPINLKTKPTIKLTAGKKQATVKITKKVANAVSYQISYATNSKFKKAKTTTFKTSKTVKKLSSKKTYYVRARAYTTINGKKVYGAWSSVKKAKIK